MLHGVESTQEVEKRWPEKQAEATSFRTSVARQECSLYSQSSGQELRTVRNWVSVQILHSEKLLCGGEPSDDRQDGRVLNKKRFEPIRQVERLQEAILRKKEAEMMGRCWNKGHGTKL